MSNVINMKEYKRRIGLKMYAVLYPVMYKHKNNPEGGLFEIRQTIKKHFPMDNNDLRQASYMVMQSYSKLIK